MKLKIDWKTLGKQLWEAVKPVLLAAIGGGIVSYTTGCSSMSTTPRGQTTEIVALGVPAVAWITHTTQEADHSGSDAYAITATNSADVTATVSANK